MDPVVPMQSGTAGVLFGKEKVVERIKQVAANRQSAETLLSFAHFSGQLLLLARPTLWSQLHGVARGFYSMTQVFCSLAFRTPNCLCYVMWFCYVILTNNCGTQIGALPLYINYFSVDLWTGNLAVFSGIFFSSACILTIHSSDWSNGHIRFPEPTRIRPDLSLSDRTWGNLVIQFSVCTCN